MAIATQEKAVITEELSVGEKTSHANDDTASGPDTSSCI